MYRQEIQEISKYVKSQKRIVEDINTKEIVINSYLKLDRGQSRIMRRK